VAPQNRWDDEDGAEHMSRTSGLFRLEAGRDRIFQSGLKTGGGAAWMVHVASSRRFCRVEAEDGWVDVTCCIGPFYSNFVIFVVLDHRGILVF
jgi:hypothetical protein